MKKELPIERNNLIDSTECWTFEKLAIIQASPYAEAWLASHLNVFMNYDYTVSFGESYYQYPFIAYHLNKNYSTDTCAYTALTKIDREIWETRWPSATAMAII
ncbi:MAG: hypothetical protein HFE78_02000 [Clostridiales bacterium]|nr:hypothetical protein [Clostridiales bacterium]